MGQFKNWFLENDAATPVIQPAPVEPTPVEPEAPVASPLPAKDETKDVTEFKSKFEQFMQFIKRYDYIGMARTYQVTAIGYPKVLLDFAKCVYAKISGGKCETRRSLWNVLKIIPAAILFGTAALAMPFLIGLKAGGLAALGIKVIQYLYSPFWIWASRHLDDPNPEVAKKAHSMMAAIPEQFKAILAVKAKQPKQVEWWREQLPMLFD